MNRRWTSLLCISAPMLKAASWLIAVYLLGTTIGAVAGEEIFIHVRASAVAPLTLQAKQAHFVEGLAREVNLTDFQKQELNHILGDLSVEFEAIHRQTDARIRETRMQAWVEIRGILTPDQRPKYDAWLRGLDEDAGQSVARGDRK